MYRVTLYDNPEEKNGIVIHHPTVGGEKIEGTIKDEINKIDTFEFTMTLENPGYGEIRPLKTFLNIFNTNSQENEFKGRIYGPSENMDDSGMVNVSYTCEGELSYLTDSMQRHVEFRGTTVEAITTIIDYHNTRVEDYKHFEIGIVEVQDPNDYMYFYLDAETNTLDTIFDKLIDKLGGELQIRYENGVRYLDWLNRIGHDSETEIRLARNLMSVSHDVDPGDIVSRLTPLGERVQSEDTEATDASQERLGISSVNGGVPYIDRPDLIEIVGVQGGSETWNDVSTPERLVTNGQNWLNNQKLILQQFEVSALDLATIGKDVDQFRTGNSHYIKNPVMAIDEWLRIIGTQKDINTPENSSLTIGDKFLTGSDYQAQQRKSARRVDELQGQLDSQSKRVIQLRHAYSEISTQVQNVQQDLTNIDVENLPIELQGIHDQLETINQNIGNLPVYGVVTPNDDGLMLADDKAKLDRLSVETAVDLDALKNNVESLQTVDLTPLEQSIADLTSRVETLEGGTGTTDSPTT